jgi:hypothetical protein
MGEDDIRFISGTGKALRLKARRNFSPFQD